ncbi:MAG: dihydropteroate synthase [Bacteroidetes bacterium]|nr:dihydropteroate synthase [Bacteroidota bacterium]
MRNFEVKDTAFRRIHRFEYGGRSLHRQRPLVMGIVNVTPDSFYEASRATDEHILIEHVGKMLDQGADIVDIGAVSTRPGAIELSADEEMRRLIPAVRAVIKHYPHCFISVDTWRAGVAQAALYEGAFMINDISGGSFDPKMPALIGEKNAPYVLMHIHGRPSDMQAHPLQAEEITAVVKQFLDKQVARFEALGASQLILDPGFGFGKTLDANYVLLSQLPKLRVKDYPMLLGISRKSMIYKLLNTSPDEALNGTTALHLYGLMQGADILRVHDVLAAREVVTLANKITEVFGNRVTNEKQ